jgi:CheY-like chemotaxis protein
VKVASYILYADNDEDDIYLMKETLQAVNIHKKLVCVSDGFAAIQYLQEVKEGDTYPSIIVLDMHMPRLNGKETLQLLKTDDMYRLIPVIILSTDSLENDQEFFKQLNTEVILKPFYYNAWVDVVNKLCSYCD